MPVRSAVDFFAMQAPSPSRRAALLGMVGEVVRKRFGAVFHRGAAELLGHGRWPCSFFHHFEDLDRRVVVVDHVALGGLLHQLGEDRLGTFGLGRDDIPLGRGGQRNSQARLQRLRAMERHPGSILQQGNHASDGRIVLPLARPFGQLGGEDHAAQIAAQLLQIIDLGATGDWPISRTTTPGRPVS